MEVSLDEIKKAQARIAAHVPHTPTLPSLYLNQLTGLDVVLKLENLNISGSFKIRGATNALLLTPEKERAMGVVAASAGNHAQGVAYVCKQLGCKSTIFMPERTPLVKVESTRMLGAEVVLHGKNFDEAFKAATAHSDQSRAVFVHPYADPKVICGQGTVALELSEQIAAIDAVLVPIGGGGLISGISCALKEFNPRIKIFGVQTEAFPALHEAYMGKSVKINHHAITIADGIAVKTVESLNLRLIKKYVDGIFLVGEEEIASSVMDLMERNHLLVEGAGAACVAALIRNRDQLTAHEIKRVVCVISGGNIDINLLSRIADRGLIQSGRLSRLKFNLPDKPGALASLLAVIGSAGANVNEIYHDRTFSSSHYSNVEIEAVVETSNHMHKSELLSVLKKNNIDYEFIV